MTAERGVDLVGTALPSHWVLREPSPDYGLDLHIEVFELADDEDGWDTLGEHFFAQVKATERPDAGTVRVYPRTNVAKGLPAYDRSAEYRDLEVVRFSLDVPELRTVEAMGAAVPVLLLVVDVLSKTVYYVCLNDYIAKVLSPENPGWRSQKTATVIIPRSNQLDPGSPAFSYVRLLARRPKLYAAFQAFHYQKHEFGYVFERLSFLPELRTFGSLRDSGDGPMLLSFLKTSLALDIWADTGPRRWWPLDDVRSQMEQCRRVLEHAEPEADATLFLHQMVGVLGAAENLGRMYEELCREWRLPTFLASFGAEVEESIGGPVDLARCAVLSGTDVAGCASRASRSASQQGS